MSAHPAERQFWTEADRGPRLAVQLVVFVLLLALLVGLYQGIPLALKRTRPPSVDIPVLRGVQEAIALDIMRRAGLHPQVVRREFHEEVPAGAVIATSPPAGRTVRTGRTVHLVLSAGSAFRQVPPLIGLTRPRAAARLAERGLRLQRVQEETSAAVPPGRVIRHTPPAGTRVQRGTGVTLVLSSGPERSGFGAVPSVRDSRVQYKEALVEVPVQGIGVQEVKVVVSDDDGERAVYRQFHAPGELVQVRVEGRGTVVVKVYLNGHLLEAKQL